MCVHAGSPVTRLSPPRRDRVGVAGERCAEVGTTGRGAPPGRPSSTRCGRRRRWCRSDAIDTGTRPRRRCSDWPTPEYAAGGPTTRERSRSAPMAIPFGCAAGAPARRSVRRAEPVPGDDVLDRTHSPRSKLHPRPETFTFTPTPRELNQPAVRLRACRKDHRITYQARGLVTSGAAGTYQRPGRGNSRSSTFLPTTREERPQPTRRVCAMASGGRGADPIRTAIRPQVRYPSSSARRSSNSMSCRRRHDLFHLSAGDRMAGTLADVLQPGATSWQPAT